MSNNRKLRITPLEERIVLDAAIAAVVATAVAHAHDAIPNTAPVIYVDANASGSVHDGKSWATAYTDLQSALTQAEAATGPQQIWMAQGDYKPSQVYAPNGVAGGALGSAISGNASADTFYITGNIGILGGFMTGGSAIGQRNPLLFPTLLDGGGADWHVVTVANDIAATGASLYMDGVTIQGGNAVGPVGSPFFAPVVANIYNDGGGMYVNFDSHVVLNNVTFTGNYAGSDAGGLFVNNSTLLVMNSLFMNNSAVVRAGAYEGWDTFDTGVHTQIVTQSVFLNNSSAVFGGAVVAEGTFASVGSSIILDSSLFQGNTAGEGGAEVTDSINLVVNNDTFIGNVGFASAGALATTNIVDTFIGGPINLSTSIYDSTFIGNVAAGSVSYAFFMDHLFDSLGASITFSFGGGALVDYMHGNLNVEHSVFLDNVAVGSDGGAILSGDSQSVTLPGHFLIAAGVNTYVDKSIFMGNQAQDGGAIAAVSLPGFIAAPNLEANVLNVTQSAFSDNVALGKGGALDLEGANVVLYKDHFKSSDAGLLGSQIAGINSVIDGAATSNASAVVAALSLNLDVIQQLDADDLYLL